MFHQRTNNQVTIFGGSANNPFSFKHKFKIQNVTDLVTVHKVSSIILTTLKSSAGQLFENKTKYVQVQILIHLFRYSFEENLFFFQYNVSELIQYVLFLFYQNWTHDYSTNFFHVARGSCYSLFVG